MSQAVIASDVRRYSDEPLSTVQHFDAIRGWGAFLTFDLRKSSKRAVRIGPRDTFLTMHTYLPVALKVLKAASGEVVGLRGDGAVAAFGIVRAEERDKPCSEAESSKMAKLACVAGEAVIRAVTEIVNPQLNAGAVESGLVVGVGVDMGEFVATRIGVMDAEEFTAYGECVNKSSHLSERGNDNVVVSNKVRAGYPSKPAGSAGFHRIPDALGLFIYRYPPEQSPFRS